MTGPVALKKIASARKELRRLYDELDFQRRAVIVSPGEPVSLRRTSPVDFSRLAQIEDLMLLLEADQQPAFTITPRRKPPKGRTGTLAQNSTSASIQSQALPFIHANPAGQVLLRLDEFLPLEMPKEAKLSCRVDTFLEALDGVRYRHGDKPRKLTFDEVPPDFSEEEAAWLNELVFIIRHGMRDTKYRKELRAEQESAERRFTSSKEYINQVIKNKDVLLMPIEFVAVKGEKEYSDGSDEISKKPRILRWFNDFIKKGRSRSAFSAVLGHIGRIEYSTDIGYYIRVVFLLDATQVSDSKSVANKIGNLLVNDFSGGKAMFSLFPLCRSDSERLVPISKIEEIGRNKFFDSVLLYMTKQDFIFVDENIKKLRQWFFRGELESRKNNRKGGSSKVDKGNEKINADVAGDECNSGEDIDDQSFGDMGSKVIEFGGFIYDEKKASDIIPAEIDDDVDVIDGEVLSSEIELEILEPSILKELPAPAVRSNKVKVEVKQRRRYAKRRPADGNGNGIKEEIKPEKGSEEISDNSNPVDYSDFYE